MLSNKFSDKLFGAQDIAPSDTESVPEEAIGEPLATSTPTMPKKKKTKEEVLSADLDLLKDFIEKSTDARIKKSWGRVMMRMPRAKKSPLKNMHPRELTDIACDFLSLPRGSGMVRPELTKVIAEYINKCGLKCVDNKTQFFLDGNLQAVFQTNEERATWGQLLSLIGACYKPKE